MATPQNDFLNAPNSDDKLWAGLSYVGLICCMIPALVIFFLKKDESSFIKFHGLQALGFGLASIVISIIVNIVLGVLSHIPVLGLLFGLGGSVVLSLAFLACWIYLIVQAFRGIDVRIPVLGDFISDNLM